MAGGEHSSKEEVLRKMETERLIIHRIRERQSKPLGYIRRKDGLENCTDVGYMESNRGLEKYRVWSKMDSNKKH